MRLRNNSLFGKYLISYIIMFMVPTLILTFFIRNSLLHTLEEQYLKNSQQSLNQLVFMTDKSFEQMESIREHLLINKSIKPNFEMDNVPNAIGIIEELRKYTLSSGWIRDMALHFQGDRYIYTTSTTSTVERYLSSLMVHEKENSKNLLQNMEAVEKDTVIPYETVHVFGVPRSLMTVLMPVNLYGHDAIVLFFTEEFFGEVPGEGCYLVFDEGGLLVSSMNLPVHIGEEELSLLWQGVKGHDDPVQFENFEDRYLAGVMTSEKTGWRFVKLATEQEIYGDLKSIQNKFLLLVWLVMVVSILITAVNMALHYNPLRKLKKLAEEVLESGGKNRKNELQGIQEVIHKLSTENQFIKRRSEPMARTSFLNQLIKGRVSSEEQFDNRIQELGMDGLKNQNYLVLICSFKNRQATLEVSEVETLINSKINGYCREHSEAGTYIFIGTFHEGEENRLRYYLLDVHQLLETVSGSEVAVACGSVCNNFKELPRSYMDASLALDYRFIKGWNHVIEFGELVLNDNMGVAYPHQLFERLAYQLKNGDADQIELVLDSIITYIKKADLPLYYAKGLCYQLINNISAVITELNNKLIVRQSSLSYGAVLAEFQTADELIDAVRNICFSICAFIKESKAEHEEALIDQIKQYVGKNCCDINFSVQSIADEFSMSSSVLSLFFKKHLGGNISDYVTSIRMEHAKKLLTAGEKSLNEIAGEAGYINTSSFIRRFKAVYGITPGQYTLMNSEGRDDENK